MQVLSELFPPSTRILAKMQATEDLPDENVDTRFIALTKRLAGRIQCT